MPLQQPSRTPIVLPVADRQLADTRIKQQATFLSLTHTQAASGECVCAITVSIALFAADGDGFGAQLVGNGFSSYTKQLLADNQTLVEAATGRILAIFTPSQSVAERQQVIDGFSQDTMLQGDFFEALRDNGLPGTIRQMIEQYIQQADAAGKFS